MIDYEHEDEHEHSRKKRNGEGGIRTLGTLLGYGALAKRCFRPLSHLTKFVDGEYDAGWRIANCGLPGVANRDQWIENRLSCRRQFALGLR
jgi:hypothetical protein